MAKTQAVRAGVGPTTMRALVVLAAAATAWRADARPAPMPILPPASCYLEEQVFPTPGATNVPLDAKVWLIGSDLVGPDHEYRLVRGTQRRKVAVTVHPPFDIVEIRLGTLLPKQTYALVTGDVEITKFTTGSRTGTTKPAAPRIATASVLYDLPQTSRIKLQLEPSDDMVLTETTVRVDGQDEAIATLIVPARSLAELGAQCASVNVWLTRMCFDVRAIDLAGHRSEPVTQCVMAEQGPGLEPYSDNRYDGPESDPISDRVARGETSGWTVVGILLCASLLGGWMFVVARERSARRAFARGEAAPVERDLVRRLVHMQQVVAEVVLALCGAVLVLLDLVKEPELRAVLSAAPLWFIVTSIAKAQRMHDVFVALADPNVTTSYDGRRFAFVHVGDVRVGWVAAAPAQLQLVAQHAVPQAKLRS